jgi:hypothetical protein
MVSSSDIWGKHAPILIYLRGEGRVDGKQFSFSRGELIRLRRVFPGDIALMRADRVLLDSLSKVSLNPPNERHG